MKNLTYLRLSGFCTLSVPNSIFRNDFLTVGNVLTGVGLKEDLPYVAPSIGPHTLIELVAHSSKLTISPGLEPTYRHEVSNIFSTHIKHPVHIYHVGCQSGCGMSDFLKPQQDNSTLISSTGCLAEGTLGSVYNMILPAPLAQHYNPNWGTPTLYFNAIPVSVHPMYFALKNKGQVKVFKYNPAYTDCGYEELVTLSKWISKVEDAQTDFERFCFDEGLTLYQKSSIHPAVEIAFARYYMFHLVKPLACASAAMKIFMWTWDFIASKSYDTSAYICGFKHIAEKITAATILSTVIVAAAITLAPFFQIPFETYSRENNVGVNDQQVTAHIKDDIAHIEPVGKVIDQQAVQ